MLAFSSQLRLAAFSFITLIFQEASSPFLVSSSLLKRERGKSSFVKQKKPWTASQPSPSPPPFLLLSSPIFHLLVGLKRESGFGRWLASLLLPGARNPRRV